MHLHRWSEALRKRTSAREAGFTLIELLVVITILGILAGIVIFAVNGIGNKGKANSAAADARVVRTAEEAYCEKFGSYDTLDKVQQAGFLAPGATLNPNATAYNAIALGDDGRCGTGSKSSFVLNDISTPTGFIDQGVPVGNEANGIAIDSNANKIYVGNSDDDTVSVIDGDTDKASGAPIPVPLSPLYMAVDSATHKVYVACACNSVPNVAVIDTANGNRVTPLRFPASGAPDYPVTIAVDTASHELYVGGYNPTITYVDTTDTAHDIDVGANMTSAQFAIDDKTNRVFFEADGGGATYGRLAVIDATAHALSKFVAFPSPPADVDFRKITPYLAVDTHANKVYATGYDSKQIPNPECPSCTSLGATGTLFAFDGNNGYAAKSLLEGPVVYPLWDSIAFNSATNQMIIHGDLGSTGEAVIAGFDGTSETGQADVKQTPAGGPDTYNSPLFLAVDPNTNRVYLSQIIAADQGANGGLAAVNMSTHLTTTLGQGRTFASVAVDLKNDKVYAVDRASKTVAILK